MADIVVGINMHSITDFDIAEHKSIYLTINDSQSLHNYLQCGRHVLCGPNITKALMSLRPCSRRNPAIGDN